MFKLGIRTNKLNLINDEHIWREVKLFFLHPCHQTPGARRAVPFPPAGLSPRTRRGESPWQDSPMTVGSSPNTSSPRGAAIIASFMAGEGCVRVSLRRSTTRAPLSCRMWQDFFVRVHLEKKERRGRGKNKDKRAVSINRRI